MPDFLKQDPQIRGVERVPMTLKKSNCLNSEVFETFTAPSLYLGISFPFEPLYNEIRIDNTNILLKFIYNVKL